MPNIYDVTTETLRQDVIETIVRDGPASAQEIAAMLDWYYEDVIELLKELRDNGLVCNLPGEGREDLFADYEFYGHHGILEEIHWRWCGGPVSKALSTAA